MKLALIGKKLGHSYSVKLWGKIWDREGDTGNFELIETEDISSLKDLISSKELDGVTVTIPYKQDVMDYLHHISPEALAAGAVNTVEIKDGQLFGYNTDVYGFQQLFNHAIKLSKHKESEELKVLVCGYGGAAKAVIYALKEMCHEVTVAVRRRNVDDIKSIITYEELKSLYSYDIIVNTTPLGMFPDLGSYPPIAYNTIRQGTIAIDLVYNPEDTEFMKRCREHGATSHNGMLMLQEQAEKFYTILKKAESV